MFRALQKFRGSCPRAYQFIKHVERHRRKEFFTKGLVLVHDGDFDIRFYG